MGERAGSLWGGDLRGHCAGPCEGPCGDLVVRDFLVTLWGTLCRPCGHKVMKRAGKVAARTLQSVQANSKVI